MSKDNKQKARGSWTDNNNMIKIVSLGVALLLWIVVAITDNPSYTQTFVSVPVDIQIQSAAFAELGLNPIEVSADTVTVKVEGDRLAVGQLTEEDLTATIQINTQVTEPRTYDLRLVPANSSLDYNRLSKITYLPDTIQVKVDRLVDQSFRISPVINGLAMSPDEDFILGQTTVSPAQVMVTGPQIEIDKIDRCTVEVDLSDPLSRTYAADLTIRLLDVQGEEIDLEEAHLTVSAQDARLVIEVLKVIELPLKLDFTNLPKNFPLEELTYTMDYDYVEVAGPVDVVGREQEIVLAYIDIRELNTDKTVYVYDVETPSDYQNYSEVNRVTVTFDSAGWDETRFTVGNIRLINQPAELEVELLGDTLYNVTFVGGADILADMTADDIVAEVDLSERELVEGQHELPVKISVPNKGLVWATGEYSVLVQVIQPE